VERVRNLQGEYRAARARVVGSLLVAFVFSCSVFLLALRDARKQFCSLGVLEQLDHG